MITEKLDVNGAKLRHVPHKALTWLTQEAQVLKKAWTAIWCCIYCCIRIKYAFLWPIFAITRPTEHSWQHLKIFLSEKKIIFALKFPLNWVEWILRWTLFSYMYWHLKHRLPDNFGTCISTRYCTHDIDLICVSVSMVYKWAFQL
jgi:hypothetical protein